MTDVTVRVSGISPDTTEESLTHFFSFCGKISSVTKSEKTATVVFEKASAAKTAQMLDGGSLDGATIHVAPEQASSEAATSKESPRPTSAEGDEVRQEDKPRSAIAAEYLAHGYVLGDQAISKAIDLDQKHGISSKFLSYFKKIDERYNVQQKATAAQTGATTRASTLDQRVGASGKLSSLFSIGRSYYEKALSSPHGAKVRQFYLDTSKQALDVHSEAKRIAEEKAGHALFVSKGPEQHELAATGTSVSPTSGQTGASVPAASAPGATGADPAAGARADAPRTDVKA